MDYFSTYTSNTIAGSGNQRFFTAETPRTGRVFYKIACGGTYSYSLLFSNIIDSTFSDGSWGHKNLICSQWNIHGAKIGKLHRGGIPKEISDPAVATKINENMTDLIPLTFDRKSSKNVAPGEFFATDPIDLTFDTGDYLCIEMTVSGTMIPYHKESILPAYVQTETGWKYERETPFPGMIGCNRPVRARIGYIGDSITQGCGTEPNTYTHWNAILSEKLGNDYAHWNLGLGYGRADDLASDGAWLYKAKHNDIIVLCAGVNDILQGFTAEQIIKNLTSIVDTLNKAGIKVLLQTVPPFNYVGENIEKWNTVNHYIHTVMREKVAFVFDTVPVLGNPDIPHKALYSGHPNAEGCRLWAEALYQAIQNSELLK